MTKDFAFYVNFLRIKITEDIFHNTILNALANAAPSIPYCGIRRTFREILNQYRKRNKLGGK